MMLRNAWPLMALLLLMHLCSCAALLGIDPIVTEDLVPPTVDEDPALPSVTIEVAGRPAPSIISPRARPLLQSF